MKLPSALIAVTMLAGCGPEAAAPAGNAAASVAGNGAASPATPPTTPADAKRFAGRWIGVEGMYLVVTPTTDANVTLEMKWDLDHQGRFTGRATRDGIAFTRNGEALNLRPTAGDATGLKYLAGKTNCLTVREGEGYCRE